MLADRYANRRVISCGILLGLLASVLFAVTVSYPLALMSRFLLGIAGALLYVPAVRHVVATFPKEKRGAVMGYVEMGSGVGMAFSLILLPLFATYASLETSFLSLSVTAAVVLASTLLFLPLVHPSGHTRSLGIVRGLMLNRRFWNLLGFHFLGMLSVYAAMGWLPTFLRADFSYSAVRAGLISTLVTVALSLGSPLAGAISDRLGRRTPVLLAGSIMAAAGFSVFILIHSAWAVVARRSAGGGEHGLQYTDAHDHGGGNVQPGGPGFSVSVAGTVGQISSSLSGLIFGYALQVSSSFAVVWGLALLCTVARIPFLLGAKEKGTEKVSAP